MSGRDYLNLLIYSDSLAFRRAAQAQDLAFTYPFLLKRLIEQTYGTRVNLVMRGGGGLRIGELAQIVKRDTGYFGGDSQAVNIAVLQFGIVDCAPHPITYAFSPAIRLIPIIGPAMLAKLVKHRRGLQRVYSYTVTSKKAFSKAYSEIVYTCRGVHIRPLAVGLPLPTLAIEHRSPGFRRNASIYNELIRGVIPDSFCDIESQISESLRDELLLPDGHHLTEKGHSLYAESILTRLGKLL